MWANNETGVIFPIARIAEMCKKVRVPFHCDGTQAVGKIPVKIGEIGVDAMSFASHKFHGPKGAGALFIRRGLRIRPLLIGGPQERQRRGGTENVPAIVGMGKAAELAGESLDEMTRVAGQRDRRSGRFSRISLIRIFERRSRPSRSEHHQHQLRRRLDSSRGDFAAAQRRQASPPAQVQLARAGRWSQVTCSRRWGSIRRSRTWRRFGFRFRLLYDGWGD